MRFWQGKRVFVTGHTGFKGSWLCLWLSLLGAKVTGYALKPPTSPNLFTLARVGKLLERSIIADIRDLDRLKLELKRARPEIIFHLAAQPIVRESYKAPVMTFSTNVMGTANLLEAARGCPTVKAIVNVTTDKCYENEELKKAFKESAPLGGHDPYSSSKACSEMVSAAYRRSYGLPIATARAGNVIGGGDWAADRLVPDLIRARLKGRLALVRNPQAIRPWQHVLEPLNGYLILAEKLYQTPKKFSGAWNFGPEKKDAKPVKWLASQLGIRIRPQPGRHPREARYLRLDPAKAKKLLGWRPRWGLKKALAMIVEWTRAWVDGADPQTVCLAQIAEYLR